MRYHQIGGDNGVRVSEIGFGCWTMGGPTYHSLKGIPIGWADVDEDDVLKGIKTGLDAGVNHFDNADIYGYGRAERMLADSLAKLGVKREDVVIASKVGHASGTAPHAYQPRHIRNQCEQTLSNLKTDTIDIYYLHHDNWASDGEVGALPEAAGVMHELKQEGKIRVIGQSAYSDAGFARSAEVLKPAVFQSWASLIYDNFIKPGAAVQDIMSDYGITFVAFGPLGKGVLLDKFDPDNPPQFEPGDVRANQPFFTGEWLKKLKPALDKLKQRYGSETADLASVCCRFVAAHPNVASVIPGFRNERQAACNVRGGDDEPFTDDDVAFCRDLFATLQTNTS